jgi:hypothetical protein
MITEFYQNNLVQFVFPKVHGRASKCPAARALPPTAGRPGKLEKTGVFGPIDHGTCDKLPEFSLPGLARLGTPSKSGDQRDGRSPIAVSGVAG